MPKAKGLIAELNQETGLRKAAELRHKLGATTEFLATDTRQRAQVLAMIDIAIDRTLPDRDISKSDTHGRFGDPYR